MSQRLDSNGEMEHVTSRRKNRPRPDNSEDDQLFPPSATKKLHKETDSTGTEPFARRQLQLDGLPRETKKGNPRPYSTPRKSEDVVSKLLAAHVKTKAKINSANCFEKQTVLDLMSTENIREESMADMALVLNSAVEVYGFRVDRCYLHAQDTRGQVAATTGKGVTNLQLDPNKDTPRKRKRDDIKQNLGDWKARIDEELERELSDEREESDEEERRHIPEEDPETFLDDIPLNVNEMDNFLSTLMSQRRKLNKKLHSHNTHLIEENDELLDRSNKELSSNEFYQKAVSRYGEGNSCALLMYNAKVSSESQAYLVHSRIVNKPTRIPNNLAADYLKNTKATLANALSDRPVSFENDLLPKIGDVLHESDGDSDEEQEPVDPNNDCFTPIKQKTAFPQTKNFRKSIIFRGKNVLIDRLWIADNSISLNPADRFGTFDVDEFTRLLQLRHQEDFQTDKSRLAPEVDLNVADLNERSYFMLNAGLDDEVKELDNLWNVQLVQRHVTQADTEEMIRKVEEINGTPDEIIAMKRRILAPGNYIFFIEGDSKMNASLPIDCWQSDNDDVLNISETEIFYDASDTGDFDDESPPAMEPLSDEVQLPNEQQAEQIADQVKAIMDRNPTPLEEEMNGIIAVDDIADVPVTSDVAANDLDEAIRNIGKDDDAHWKGNKAADVEKEKDAKKTKKKQPEENKTTANIDNYWVASNPDMRREALERFSLRVNRNNEKPEGMIFLSRPCIRTPYAVYDFEKLNKVGCLNGKVRYPDCSWATSLKREELLAKGVEFMNTSLLDDEGKDILGIEYFRALRGVQIMIEDERNENNANPESDTEAPTDVEEVDNVDNDSQGEPQSFEDDLDGAESFHTANGNPWSPGAASAAHQLWPSKKNKVQEIRDLQAADDVEDEGEVAQGLEGNFVIKNTSVDQSKVKGYLKNILTNKMLDRKCLKTVTEAANDREYLDQTFQAVRNMTLHNDVSVMNGSFEFKSTGIDPLEVSRCVFTATEELSQPSAFKHQDTNMDGASQEALQNAVVLSDFDVAGEHSLSSMLACLPYRAQRNSEKNMHVASLFSVALQMCNENTLHCVQEKNSDDGCWMGDFILRNGTGGTQPSSSSFNPSRPMRAPRERPEVIPEDDEMEDSQ